jgi:NitT/TauT family transport system permease protein
VNRHTLTKIGFFVLLLGLWQVLGSSGLWPPYLFPSFSDVLASFWTGFFSPTGTLDQATYESLRRLAVGYGLSVVVGIPLGLVWGRSVILQDTVGPLILGLQALPSISWLPIALLWFGLSEGAILFVVFMGAVWSIAIATRDGTSNIPAVYLRAARNLGAKGVFLHLKVLIPASLPPILSGMKLGWSFAWRSLMAGELLYYGIGLGQQLAQGRELNDMSLVVAVMLIIIFIGLVVDKWVFRPLEKAVRRQFNLG